MEIGQQRVDGAEAIAGGDEDRRLAFEGAKRAVLAGGAFEQPRRGRADGDDAAAARARRVERRGGRRVEPAPFRVHGVAGGVVDLHRQERAGADMQRQAKNPSAGRFDARDQLRGEMQPGGRRGDRPLLVREHRLVVGAIGRRDPSARGDIGRQRRRADAVDRLVERRAVKGEGQSDLAVLAFRLDLGVERRRAGRPCSRALSPKRMRSPTFSFFAGLTSARQRLASRRLISVASMAATAAPRTRMPSSRAAMTRVSLTTSASPGFSSRGRSNTCASSSPPSGATTSIRAASRGLAGFSAMRSGGRSKSNRSTRISPLLPLAGEGGAKRRMRGRASCPHPYPLPQAGEGTGAFAASETFLSSASL